MKTNNFKKKVQYKITYFPISFSVLFTLSARILFCSPKLSTCASSLTVTSLIAKNEKENHKFIHEMTEKLMLMIIDER